MAEVATCILHNIGNVLNSVNISTQLLIERSGHFEIESLTKLAELLEKNKHQMDTFIQQDQIGKMLPDYIKQLSEYWKTEKEFICTEMSELNEKVQHIKTIVIMQQSLSKSEKVMEKLDVNSLLEDALLINSIEKHSINIQREYVKTPIFEFDKVKILQILVNLTKNSMESLIESSVQDKILLLRTQFSYGFTTKVKGHGFGLHSCALAAQESGGSLTAHSPGLGKGSTFVLRLPILMQKKPEENASDIKI
jgi:signal transduction histidine kinase